MPNKIQLIFFGTHDFAAEILSELLLQNDMEIISVITKSDKPKGRQQTITPTQVKNICLQHQLPIISLSEIKNSNIRPTLNIVVDFGLIIKNDILTLPQLGSINIHPSLLPKYRGPSPIQTALLNGESETGVSIMLMDEIMDHGPILQQTTVPINFQDDYLSLKKKLANVSRQILPNVIRKYVNNELSANEQNHETATFCRMIELSDGKLSFVNNSNHIINQFRAYNYNPGIWCQWNNKSLKLHKITQADKVINPGLVKIENKRLFIGCNNGSIEAVELQLEGKKIVNAVNFINGHRNIENAVLT